MAIRDELQLLKEEEVKLKTKFDQAKVDVNQNLPATLKWIRLNQQSVRPIQNAASNLGSGLCNLHLDVVLFDGSRHYQRTPSEGLDLLATAQISNRWLIYVSLTVLPLVALAIAYEFWYAFLLPPVLLVVWLTLYRLDWAMWIIVFATPISVNLTDLTGGAGLSVPTEPMLVLVTLIALIKMILQGNLTETSFGIPSPLPSTFIWLGCFLQPLRPNYLLYRSNN